MLLSISSQPSRRKTHPLRTLNLQCDVCGRKYEKKYFFHLEFATHHACSRTCSGISQQLGGVIDEKKRQTFRERYGVDNAQQVPGVREKTRATNIERYGVDVGSKSDSVKTRAKITNQERYGVDWHTQSTNFSVKSKQKWEQNYGVNHPMKSDVVKSKYDFNDIWKQAHETKKKNGSYASSSSEQKFLLRLRSLFECVEVQAPVNHESGTWYIDFKIENTYVQFDGAYWHGLDRKLEEIKLAGGVRNNAIVKAYERDREQDSWFESQGLRLKRITDRQAKSITDDELRTLISR